jgi:hypothetical protein
MTTAINEGIQTVATRKQATYKKHIQWLHDLPVLAASLKTFQTSPIVTLIPWSKY